MARKATVRKCSHCGKTAKRKLFDGKNKGWYKTCGRAACIHERLKPGAKNLKVRNPRDKCELCNKSYIRKSWKQRWCKRCVPTVAWRHRARRYGVGKVQWKALLAKQGGTCALCDNKPSVVDHDHKSGVVRGLVCHLCNGGLATLDRNGGWHKRARKYRTGARK